MILQWLIEVVIVIPLIVLGTVNPIIPGHDKYQ